MLPKHRLLQVITTVALLVAGVIPAAEAATYIVAPMYQLDYPSDTTVYSAYATGAFAPAAQASGTLQYTVSVTSVSASSGFSVFMSFSKSTGNDVMAMFGPGGTSILYSMYQGSSFSSQSFLTFGPLAQSQNDATTTTFLLYRQQVYWTMPSEQAQAVALLVLLSKRERFPLNQLLFRISGRGLSVSSKLLYDILQGVYGCTIQTVVTTTYTASVYSNAIAKNPGIVYQYGEAQDNVPTATWNANLVADPTLIQINATIATTFQLHHTLLEAYNTKATTAGSMLPPGNIFTAAPVPGVDSQEYAAPADFVDQSASMFTAGMSNMLKNYMMAGWMSATALMQALSKFTSLDVGNSYTFIHAIYLEQCSYMASDLFVGTFTPKISSCSQAAVSQGLLCGCHHGGNNIWFQNFVKVGSSTYDTTAVTGELYQYALGNCANLIPPGDMITVEANSKYFQPYNVLISTPVPVYVAGLAPSDNTVIQTMCEQTHDVITRVSNTNLYQHASTHVYRGYCIPSTVNTATTALTSHTKAYAMTSMMGVIPNTVSTPTTLVLDYIPQTTQPHVSQANLVFLFPTLDQELYVLATYLRGVVTDASTVCAAVTLSSMSGSIVSLLRTTLATHGFVLSDGNVFQPTGDLGASILSTCMYTFVIGVGDDDAAGVVQYLNTNSKAYVLASFDDLTKYYTSLSSSLGSAGTAVTNRFLFATNLPLWTATASNPTAAAASAPLSTVSQFLQSVPVELHTPAAVRAYIVAMLYDQLTAGGEPGTGDMQSMLYGNVSWTISGVQFGPFSMQCTVAVMPTGTTCLQNYGARSISVWSYTSVVDPTTPVIQDAITPSMLYDASGTTAIRLVGSVSKSTDEKCIEVPSSSMEAPTSTTTTTSAPSPGVSSTSTATPSLSKHSSSSSENDVLSTAIIVMSVCLGVVVIVIVLLLLVGCGLLRWCKSLVTCCDGTRANRKGPAILRARGRQQEKTLALQRASRDVSRAPSEDAASLVTFVCIDVAQYCALWIREPELMSRAVAEYQSTVRHLIGQHGCYEVDAVDGLFVIACDTADDGVKLAQDCAAAFPTGGRVAAAVDAAYTAMGLKCEAPEARAQGLRLRIAVHCGVAARDTASRDGRVRWSGGAVDDVVCAAYCGKAAWQVVATEIVRNALIDDALDFAPLCSATLVHSGATQLFVLERNSARHSGEGAPLGSESSSHVLQLLQGELSTHRDTLPTALCCKSLQAFMSICCRGHDTSYLIAIAHCLCVPPLSRDDYDNEREFVDALLRGVCERLGMLMQLRRGVCSSDTSTIRGRPPGVTREGDVSICREDSGPLGTALQRTSNGRKHRNHTRRIGVLRHFSYALAESVDVSQSSAIAGEGSSVSSYDD